MIAYPLQETAVVAGPSLITVGAVVTISFHLCNGLSPHGLSCMEVNQAFITIITFITPGMKMTTFTLPTGLCRKEDNRAIISQLNILHSKGYFPALV